LDSTYFGEMKMAKAKTKKAKSEKPRKPKLVKLYDTELDPLKEADGLLKQIEAAETEAEERALRVEMVREELTGAKTAYKDAVTQLRRLCRARKEKHPLFDKSNPSELTKEPPAKEAEWMPEINYNQPSTAVTIELTEDCLDIDKQLVKGNTYHPWGISVGGCVLLLNGNESFIADVAFRYAAGSHLVEAALSEHPEGYNAMQWEAWLRARPEAKRPEFVERADAGSDGAKLPLAHSPNGWRGLQLDVAGINGRAGKSLEAAGVGTLGELVELQRKIGVEWFRDVKGLGAEGAGQVDDLVAKFWTDHPEYCVPGRPRFTRRYSARVQP
jgi:hypothetical protein